MTKSAAKFIRFAMGIAVVLGYIGGVIVAIIFDNWLVLLGAPLFYFTAPDPYRYFGGQDDHR